MGERKGKISARAWWHGRDAATLAQEAALRAPSNLAKRCGLATFAGNVSCEFAGCDDKGESLDITSETGTTRFRWTFSHRGTAVQPMRVESVDSKPARRALCYPKSALFAPRPIANSAIVAYTMGNLDHGKRA